MNQSYNPQLIYVFELGKHYANLNTKERSVRQRRSDGQELVRLKRKWVILHRENELKSLLRTKVVRAKRVLAVDGYQTDPRVVVARPFVKDWEENLGTYPTYGPGGI